VQKKKKVVQKIGITHNGEIDAQSKKMVQSREKMVQS